MKVDELTSPSDLVSLLPGWWALHDSCRAATPFHSPSVLLTGAVPQELESRIMTDQPSPFITLPKSPAEFLANLSSNCRHRYQTARKRLQDLGSVTFESADDASLKEMFDALFSLNEASRRNRGKTAPLSDTKLQAFHRDVGGDFLRRGWLRMTAMCIGPKIVSVLYGFACGSRAYYYQSGFDPCLSKSSHGTALLGYVIERGIRKGLTELDLLRGNEPYKYWWGARDRLTHRLTLWRSR
jgi:CelD/BcsL family acetyltransferase involved in cellulose biosynthesis